MIFSIIIGVTSALYFVIRALIVKLKFLLSGGKKISLSKNKFVIYAEDKRYFSLFLPILEEAENRGIALLYLTSSKDDPVFDYVFKYIKAEYLGEGNKAFAKLNFISADFILSTTPGLDVYQWKRSKNVKHYSHLLHSPGESTTYEIFGFDYYNSILVSSGSFQENDIRKIEKIRKLPEKNILTVGCPYLDIYSEKIKNIPKEEKHIFTVLISPSWGKSSILVKYGEKIIDPLLSADWKIIIRPHPQSLIVEKEIIDNLCKKYEKNINLEWDFERDNVFSLSKADIMISDFSGIIFDYMFLLNRPVIYACEEIDLRPYDSHLIYNSKDDMYTFQILKEAGIKLTQDLFPCLPDIIQKTSNDNNILSSIIAAKEEAWRYQGEAGKRVVDFMIKTVEQEVL
jgi:hypothetical protein